MLCCFSVLSPFRFNTTDNCKTSIKIFLSRFFSCFAWQAFFSMLPPKKRNVPTRAKEPSYRYTLTRWLTDSGSHVELALIGVAASEQLLALSMHLTHPHLPLLPQRVCHVATHVHTHTKTYLFLPLPQNALAYSLSLPAPVETMWTLQHQTDICKWTQAAIYPNKASATIMWCWAFNTCKSECHVCLSVFVCD